ncbi:MAG: penicillin-binding protein activator [Nitrospinae bacterium]|nr:penicillin-binding protein activator [Nitrospinota bacterium]
MGFRNYAKFLSSALAVATLIVSSALAEGPAPTAPVAPPSAKGATIGCVLPLSGDTADAANQALKGIQMAFSAKSRFVDSAGIKLILKDSGGSAESTALAMKELSAEGSVVGVVGMFTPDELVPSVKNGGGLAVIAPYAGGAQEAVKNHVPGLYQIGLANASQAELTAEVAVKNLGLKYFAILQPDNAYGGEFAALFAGAVKKQGGVVTSIEKFEVAQTDFRAQMTALGGMDDHHLRQTILAHAKDHPNETIEELNADLEKKYGKGKSYPQISKTSGMPLTKNNFSFEMRVGYDALFLPAGYEQAGLILPALVFYNITNVQVLGTDGMLSSEFVTIGGKYVRNAVFTGEFHPNLSGVAAKAFVENFKSAFGDAPDAVSARYYDATMMLINLVEEYGAVDRATLSAALESLKTYKGVAGLVTREADGSLKKTPSLFTVEGGKISEFHPPPPEPPQEVATPEKPEPNHQNGANGR